MPVYIIPQRLLWFWERWNIRGTVLTSLGLQILLIFLAPLRKCIKSDKFASRSIIWSAYLLADFVAAYGIGLISSNQGNKGEKVGVDIGLSAFWAPFLLLHLGGPDSITAFALADNELWLRHLFSLVVLVFMIAYVFTQAIPFDFWLPTILVFLAATIKYAERTRALYLACLDNFQGSNRPDWWKGFSNEITSIQHEKYIDKDDTRNEIEKISDAYRLYTVFSSLIVGHMLDFEIRRWTRIFFFQMKPRDAFRVMEVELNFMYDQLFTKKATLHRSWFVIIFHLICTALIAVTFILFEKHHKPNIQQFDIGVTNSLLIGAIILDLVALINLVLSDWTIVLVNLPNVVPIIYKIQKSISLGGRWSKYVPQHSLISFYVKKQSNKWVDRVLDHFGSKALVIILWWYKDHSKPLEDDLEEFIFENLKEIAKEAKVKSSRTPPPTFISNLEEALNAKEAEEAKQINSLRGGWALRHCPRGQYPSIVESVGKNIEYDKSWLTWHIATDLLLNGDGDGDGVDVVVVDPESEKSRSICKIFSDYMFYLHVLEPSLMSTIAGSFRNRFQDTCQQLNRILEPRVRNREEACKQLGRKGTPSSENKSVLNDAWNLAKELKVFYENDKREMWKTMSKVWLELLCYAANHCRGNMHAQQLSRGGELITFVWLLIAHFGMGDHFG